MLGEKCIDSDAFAAHDLSQVWPNVTENVVSLESVQRHQHISELFSLGFSPRVSALDQLLVLFWHQVHMSHLLSNSLADLLR